MNKTTYKVILTDGIESTTLILRELNKASQIKIDKAANEFYNRGATCSITLEKIVNGVVTLTKAL